MTAALLDSAGRFIGNVGVPAAIAFFILLQITPRLDNISTNQVATNTTLTLIAASCGGIQRGATIAYLTPSSLDVVP
jgi:hypothetical protein